MGMLGKRCRETGCSSKEGANYRRLRRFSPERETEREREKEGESWQISPDARNYRPFKLDLSLHRCFPTSPIQTSMKRRHEEGIRRITFEFVSFFSSKVISLKGTACNYKQ